MRVFVKIAVALTVLLCAFSCGKEEEQGLAIKTLIISGNIFDMATDEAVNGVSVYVMGYESDDSSMQGSPVSVDIVTTGADGFYKLTKINPVATEYYKVVAIDNSFDRVEKYRESLKYLYLSRGTAYNERTRTYELKDIDFYLQK